MSPWQIPVTFREPVQTVSAAGSTFARRTKRLTRWQASTTVLSHVLRPPPGWAWRVQAIWASMGTGAAVGNRFADVSIYERFENAPAPLRIYHAHTVPQPKNCIGYYSWAVGNTDWNIIFQGHFISAGMALPDLLLSPSSEILIHDEFGLPGDSIAYNLYGEQYEEIP